MVTACSHISKTGLCNRHLNALLVMQGWAAGHQAGPQQQAGWCLMLQGCVHCQSLHTDQLYNSECCVGPTPAAGSQTCVAAPRTGPWGVHTKLPGGVCGGRCSSPAGCTQMPPVQHQGAQYPGRVPDGTGSTHVNFVCCIHTRRIWKHTCLECTLAHTHHGCVLTSQEDG